MKINFMSLGSGSSGNCSYLWTDTYGILIDAGVGIRNIKKFFKDMALDINKVIAILVTHDHADHIKAVGNLSNTLNIPVYTTREVHKGMERSYCMTKKLSEENKKFILKEESFMLRDFKITCFEVPHDGTDNVGYNLVFDNKVFTFITDIGHITPTASRYIDCANYLILEANYDHNMLMAGRYPEYLKQRIYGDHGHLCNDELASYMAGHYSPSMKYLWLCHLSNDNNTPELARRTVESALREKNINPDECLKIIPLRRVLPSDIYTFD